MISKKNLLQHFLLLSNSVKLLSNVIEILFQITLLRWNAKQTKISIFDISLLLIKVTKLTKLLVTFVLCMEMTSLLTEQHRNGFLVLRRGSSNSQMQALIKELCQTTRKLVQKMTSSYVTVAHNLYSMVKSHKHGATYIGQEKQTPALLNCCQFTYLVPSYSWIQRKIPLSYCQDEKWCLYMKMKQGKEQLQQAGNTSNQARAASMQMNDLHLAGLTKTNLL